MLKWNCHLFGEWTGSNWILGASRTKINPVIWVLNFVIYKAMLRSFEGYNDDIIKLFESECGH